MEDEKLVAWFLETGDQAAFSQIVERYQKKVFRLVCSVLGPFSEASAEEVCQEVFLKLYRKMKLFSSRSNFSTWLYRLAYNTALDWRRQNRIRISLTSSYNDKQDDQADYSGDPLNTLLDEERRILVLQAIEELPEIYRTITYLHYWLDTPLEEVAGQLGLPEGTVKSYLFRSREILRKLLEKKLTGTGRPEKGKEKTQ
ncbi:MAG: RNA polymerase sigma factor RpoE [Candidatus Saccharicenans subterraneus]|uniref:RNA polymerase sigma factor RpoE n=1 Tax=Candidatus Saccharicenans subterraneus TaxID=2508984 RepID=A0A3E2BL55_9BACT|nr:MAG: RNA polymerase sigma factor RpoE [Candidatus Saccharicenans subterraneum]